MKTIQLNVGRMGNMSYIIYDEENLSAAFVDPSWEPEKITGAASDRKLKPSCVLLTHGHDDHVNAVPELLKIFPGLPVYMDAKDDYCLKNGFPGHLPLTDGKEIADFPYLRTLSTPGHTPGSVCFVSENEIFTGDTLFVGACGRWDLPGSDGTALGLSLEKIGGLPDRLKVYTGHDYNGNLSTLAREKRFNGYLRFCIENGGKRFSELM